MTSKLYKQVILNRDIPEEGLRAGDVGYYVETLEHPSEGETGAILEIFNFGGESRLVSVPLSAIEAPIPDLVVTARKADSQWFK